MNQEFVATLNIPVEHPAFAGHFPGRPIVPGVVLLDEALLALQAQRGVRAGGWRIASAKFLSPVAPGEVLEAHFAAPSASGATAFRIVCGERLVASGSLAPAESA